MRKAEERALERYPVHKNASKMFIEAHLKGFCNSYIEGYEQAEKDLILTWKDVMKLEQIIKKNKSKEMPKSQSNKEYYEEVLRQFLERKGYKL